jgi:hypothetical protein
MAEAQKAMAKHSEAKHQLARRQAQPLRMADLRTGKVHLVTRGRRAGRQVEGRYPALCRIEVLLASVTRSRTSLLLMPVHHPQSMITGNRPVREHDPAALDPRPAAGCASPLGSRRPAGSQQYPPTAAQTGPRMLTASLHRPGRQATNLRTGLV